MTRLPLILSLICLLLQVPDSLGSTSCATNPEEEERPWLNFWFNAGGNAARRQTLRDYPQITLSLNMERTFFIRDNLMLAGSLGLGLDFRNILVPVNWLDSGSEDPLLLGDRLLLIPHHIMAGISIDRKRKLFIESGLAGSRIFNSADRKYILYPLAGLRYQPLERNRMMFRIYGAFPTSNLKQTGLAFNHLGFSFGWSLAKDPD